MRRLGAAVPLVVQRVGKKVATRLRVEKGLRCCWADLGRDKVKKLLAAHRRVRVGQKSRGSLLSYHERRSQSKPFGAAQACTSSPGTGGVFQAVGGVVTRGYRPIGASPGH